MLRMCIRRLKNYGRSIIMKNYKGKSIFTLFITNILTSLDSTNILNFK